MKTKVKALTSFIHGRVDMRIGDQGEFTKGDAEDLAKAGLVEVMGEQAESPAAAQQTADDGVDDLLGGEKMGDAPQNKMEADPDNKAGGKKTPTAKK